MTSAVKIGYDRLCENYLEQRAILTSKTDGLRLKGRLVSSRGSLFVKYFMGRVLGKDIVIIILRDEFVLETVLRFRIRDGMMVNMMG
jgi:hypothetical protein